MKTRNAICLPVMLVSAMSMYTGLHGETLPDPTRPANYAGSMAVQQELPDKLINWKVRAIRTSERGRNAIVNGRLVKVGDEVDSATIVDITSDTVVLSHDRKQLVLRLVPWDIKQKHVNAGDTKSD